MSETTSGRAAAVGMQRSWAKEEVASSLYQWSTMRPDNMSLGGTRRYCRKRRTKNYDGKITNRDDGKIIQYNKAHR
jgi:hypothetical protein